MQTQELGVVLTGFMRFQLSNLWHKQKRQGNKEDFIQKVCKQKGIIYTPPIKAKRMI